MISDKNVQFNVSYDYEEPLYQISRYVKKEHIPLMTSVNMLKNILYNLNMHMFNSVIDAFKKAETSTPGLVIFRTEFFENGQNTNISVLFFSIAFS